MHNSTDEITKFYKRIFPVFYIIKTMIMRIIMNMMMFSSIFVVFIQHLFKENPQKLKLAAHIYFLYLPMNVEAIFSSSSILGLQTLHNKVKT